MGENEEVPQEVLPLTWDKVPESKKEIREKIWEYIESNNLANFPRPVTDRIPNFKGADEASQKATEFKVFESAKTVKVNPDKPQEGIRYRTMVKEKELLVPTPRLKSGLFNRIEPPDQDEETLRKCSMQQGVKLHRKPINLEDNVKVDVIYSGSVAVSKKGIE